MFGLDALLPPILGGFLFVILFFPLSFWSNRQEGYKLFFTATIAGVVLLMVATGIIALAARFPVAMPVIGWWDAHAPAPYSAASALAFLLGGLLWYPGNKIAESFEATSRFAVIRRLVAAKGDPLETLLVHALEHQTLLQVTLTSGKVYVGTPTVLLNPSHTLSSLHLSLRRSGYRDEAHRLILNTDYEATHEEIAQEMDERYQRAIQRFLQQHPEAEPHEVFEALAERDEGPEQVARDFATVVMTSELQSVSPFNLELFDRHFRDG